MAVGAGAGLAVVLALILGEYPFTGVTPYVAALAVPAIIGFVVTWVGRRHPARLWAYTGIVAAASVGWALYISTGRGVDPVPVGGWVAVALALLWPVAVGGWVARRP